MANSHLWKNKKRTSDRDCACGSWRAHWINRTGRSWPITCSVSSCASRPVLGAHVISSSAKGERIVPMCSSCNHLSESFTFTYGTVFSDALETNECGT